MAAPEYVPRPTIDDARVYRSAPRRPGSWTGDRPAELEHGQPAGPGFGNQGPDQGYALRLAEELRGQLHLRPGEHEADAVAGCVAVALKRASMFGRAPVIHDLHVAATVWGFYDETPDDALIAARRRLFAEASAPHHEPGRRAIAAAVPDATLRMAPVDVTDAHTADWESLLDLAEVSVS